VLVSRCGSTGCHDDITHEEGYIFTSYTSAMKAVKPGNVNDSKLYEVITDDDSDDRMPPAGKPQLLKAEIDSIAKWISYGALNENCGEACDTINPVSFSADVLPLVNTYCSGCHSGTAPQGGVTLTSYSNVSGVAASGLLGKVLRGSGAPKMPPSGAFSECRIRQLEMWIADGYKNN
jgi:mono/diheme cytochrome c family protein